MTKERTILASIAIVTGLIIASSVFYFYQKGGAGKGSTTPAPSPQVSVSNGKTALEIESPENESITDKKTAEVKGKTQPAALVVVTTNTEDFVLQADSSGTFNQKVTLLEDENLLTVTAYTENGTSETKEVAITYTTEEF